MRNLRELRAKKGVTQKEVAEAIGISRYTLIKLEKGGEGLPSTVKALADYYGVSPLYLCELKDIIRKEYLPSTSAETVELCKLVSNYAD